MKNIILSLFIVGLVFTTNAQVIDYDKQSVYNGYSGEKLPAEPDTVPTLVELKPAERVPSLETEKTDEPNALRSYPTYNLHPHIPNQVTPDRSKEVGQISITEGTLPTGGRTYTVPVMIEPGRNGAQPQISISYNSQGGDGFLGKGWSIGGLSAMVRGNFSIYYDGKTDGYYNITNDPFYLDGTRLIKKSQTSGKIEYLTEQGNIKVEAFLFLDRVRYFKVWYPNGVTSIMGFTANYINKPVYPVTQTTDKDGNVIDYNYHVEDNIYRIKDIQYGKNGSASHFASVSFTYTPRSDVSFGWQAGQKSINKHLLSKIDCKSGSSTISSYSFTYTGETQSLLEKIACSVNGSELNPLIFYYGGEIQSPQLVEDTTKLFSWFDNSTVDDLTTKKGKFDAWSDDDGLIVYPTKDSYREIYIPGGTFHHSKKYYQNLMHPDQEMLVYHGLSDDISLPQTSTAGEGFIDIFAADTDGVPNEEVVKVNLTTNGSVDKVQFKLHKSSATAGGLGLWKTLSFETSTTLDWYGKKSVHPKYFFAGDFDGDGRMEVFAVSCNAPLGKTEISSRCYLFDLHSNSLKYDNHVFDYNVDYSNYNNNDIIFPFDYNGDGKTDICLINDTGLHIYSFNVIGTSYSMSIIATYTGLKKRDIKYRRFMVGEFNSDEKVDLIVSPSKSYSTSFNYNIPVSTPRFCNHCYHTDPVDLSMAYYEYPNFRCKYCNEQIAPSDYCYECHSQLQYDYQGGGPGKVCPVHGSSVNVTYNDYIDNGKTWSIYYNKGNGQFDKKTVDIRNNDREDSYALQDMNGDGTTDLVCRNKYGGIDIYPTINSSFTTTRLSGYVSVGRDAYIIPSEVSQGNYYSQMLALNNDKIHKLRHSVNKTEQSLLTGAVNSFGVVSKTRYGRMNGNEPGLYNEGYGATFPYQNFSGPIYLTAETQTWFNNSKRGHQTFGYTGGILHRQGLGFRGFEQTSSYDQISNRSTTNTYDPTRFGVLTKQQSSQATVNNLYNVFVAYDKTAKVTLTKKTVNDLLKGNTITSSYLYDTYGHPAKETISYGGGTTTTTDIEYANTATTSKYLLGQPKNKTVSKKANGHTFVEKTEWIYTNDRPETIKELINGNLVNETTLSYDAFGNVTQKKEKAYNSSKEFLTRFAFDNAGRYLDSITNYMGQKTSYTRDALGRIETETNFKGHITGFEYDDMGRKTKVTLPSGEVTATAYNWDTSGGDYMYRVNNSSNIAPDAKEHFDAFGRSIEKSTMGFDGEWVGTKTEYDDQGRLARQSAPFLPGVAPKWTSYAYDYHNRPTRITAPTGAVTSYSYNGNSVTVTKEGRTSTKTTNARGDLVSATDPGGTIIYNFRGDGQPTNIIAPGGIENSFAYDDYGRKTQMTDPSAGTITYDYDVDGNLKLETNANNKTIERKYDHYNRLKQEIAPEMTTTYSYNTDGLLTCSSSTNGTSINYSYNNLLQLTSVAETVGSEVYVEIYEYDNGRLKRTTHEPMTYIVEYEYNTHNHLKALKSQSSTLWTANARDAYGNITKQTLGNGVVVNQSYNEFGLPTQIKAEKGSQVIQNFGYSFDPLTGNLESRSDQIRNMAETFEYDNLDRLTECKTLGVPYPTQYHANGNIKSLPGIGQYAYTLGDKPYAVTGIENTGSVVSEATQVITYTSFERPRTITEGSHSVSYTYNAAYHRAKAMITKNGNTSTVYSFMEGKYQQKIEGGTKKGRLYIGGTPYSAPIVIEYTGIAYQKYYLHRDYLGSITHITNQSGNLEAEYSYTAWGRLRNPANWQVYAVGQEPQLMFDRGYTGHEHLTQFGLINMNARLYDPALGRFLSADPYVQLPDFSQNFNRYSYALNNPLKFTDPDGEFFWFAIAIGAIINTTVKAISGDINSVGDFFVAAGIGALSGAAGALGAGAAVSLINGYGLAGTMASATIGLSTTSSFINGATIGAFAGFSGGFVGGAANAWTSGKSFGEGLMSGLKAGGIGAVTGGMIGGAASGYQAYKAGANFWTGKTPLPEFISPVLDASPYTPTNKISTSLGKFDPMYLDSELAFDGNNLDWIDNYSHGKRSTTSTSATSGPWGKGALPNGKWYTGESISPTANSSMTVGSTDFAIPLKATFNLNGRGGFYIHPDGGQWPGTLGCIGLNGSEASMINFLNKYNLYYQRYSRMTLNVTN